MDHENAGANPAGALTKIRQLKNGLASLIPKSNA